MNISLAAEPLFYIGTLPITNTMLMALALLAFFGVLIKLFPKKLQMIPKGFQNIAEVFIDFAFNFVDQIVGDKKRSRLFFPLVATIFLVVLFSNLMEVIPGLGSIGIYEQHEGHTVLVPFIRSTSADLNFTMAIAIVAVFAIQYFGAKQLGLGAHLSKYFHFKNPILFFVGILELLLEGAKVVSFSFRLFGNIFAGEVLLTVTAFLVPFLIPLPFLGLEMFVGLVQATVFSVLTLVFLSISTTPHETEH